MSPHERVKLIDNVEEMPYVFFFLIFGGPNYIVEKFELYNVRHLFVAGWNLHPVIVDYNLRN